jgi:Trypsin-co-occurring domain 1
VVQVITSVRVETVELDAAGTRQIGSRHRTSALLRERRGDIEAAVGEACEIVQDSVTKVDARNGWRVSSLEAKFSITLGAEAGAIISKASAEASFEITVTIERTGDERPSGDQ